MNNILKNRNVLAVTAIFAVLVFQIGVFPISAYAAGDEGFGDVGSGWDSLSDVGSGWDLYSDVGSGWDSYNAVGSGWDSLSDVGSGWDSMGNYTEYTVPGNQYTEYSVPGNEYTEYSVPGDTYSESFSSPDTYSESFSYENASYAQSYTQQGYAQSFAQGYSYPITYAQPIRPITPQYPVQQIFPQPLQPYCVITTSPSSINQGGSATLTWNSANATSATLSGGGNGTVPTNGSQVVHATVSTTYFLTVRGSNGQSANCQTFVSVNTYVPPVVPPPTYNTQPYCSITVSNYNYGGQYQNGYNQPVTISWTSSYASSAYINNGVGSVSTSGSQLIYPSGNTTYIMTVYGNGGYANCQVNVTNTVPPVYPPVNQSLYCSITASPASVQNGQTSNLSWTSYGASSAYLSDGIGSVNTNGLLAVQPDSSRNYTLTVYGTSGASATCQTNLTVAGQYVALSSVPYTGFDFGPVGNAMFWLSLLAFAAASAYLLVYYRGGTFAGVSKTLGARFTSAVPQASIVHERIIARITETSGPTITQKTVLAPLAIPTSAPRRDSMLIDGSRIVIARA